MPDELGPLPGQGQVRQGKSGILLYKLGQEVAQAASSNEKWLQKIGKSGQGRGGG